MNRRRFLCLVPALSPAALSRSVEVVPGPVNGVILTRLGKRLAIYGDPRTAPLAVDQVLLTDFRRDVCWAARDLARRGAAVVAPAAEADLIAQPQKFWREFEKTRFHDYAMIPSKVLAQPLPVSRTVHGGARIEWNGLVIEVLDTPGYTRGAVSYLFTADGRRIACVGDLIYGGGHLLDLYSLQDAVPEAKLRGYHGYAARAGELIRSLRSVAARKPDLLIPARGPVVHKPAQAIEQLITRLKAVLREHFKTDALRWYFGDDSLRLRAAKLLEGEVPPWMPMAETVERKLPPWLVPIRNSRLLLSQTGAAFLIDCGSDKIIEELERLRSEGRFQTLEGIFITHYHDDHTDRAQLCSEKFHCPVYFSEELREILEHPQAYRMPCLTSFPIRGGRPMPQGARQRWHEFEFTYSYFPGQTLLHDSLLVEKDGGGTVLFLGDSFTPSGLDDYCLWNRNFLGPEPGFLQCLEQIRRLPPGHLLVNQHVEPAFRFSPAQLDFMTQSLRRRAGTMKQLFPWPGVNFGIDEQWARLAPYETTVPPGRPFDLRAVIWNHSPEEQEFVIRPNLPDNWSSDAKVFRLRVPPRSEGSAAMRITAPSSARGLSVVTIDLNFGPWRLREWTEALARVTA